MMLRTGRSMGTSVRSLYSCGDYRSNGGEHLWLLADRARDLEPRARVPPAERLYLPRQVASQMPAGADEHRHDRQLAAAKPDERADPRREIRPHAFEVGGRDAHPVQLRAQRAAKALDRSPPLRIARPVREEDDGPLQCSVARRPS